MLLDHCGVNDNRVIREARALKNAGYEVRVFCLNLDTHYTDFEQDSIPFIQCPFDIRQALPFISARRLTEDDERVDVLANGGSAEQNSTVQEQSFGLSVKRVLGALYFHKAARMAFSKKLEEFDPAIIHAHDLTTLPSGTFFAKLTNAKLIYDSHELECSRNEVQPALMQAIRMREERNAIGSADVVLTVSDSIADELSQSYRIARPYVILNAPDHPGKANYTSGKTIRDAVGLRPDQTLGVYVGAIQEGRGLLEAVKLLAKTPDLHLALLGPKRVHYIEAILSAAQSANVSDRIYILEPVAPESLIPFIKTADFSIIPIQKTSRSYDYALPNKLFEALAANLPVLTTPLKELAAFIDHYGVGVKSPGFNADALKFGFDELRRNNESILRALKQGDWHSAYGWTAQKQTLLSVYTAINEGKLLPSNNRLPHFSV